MKTNGLMGLSRVVGTALLVLALLLALPEAKAQAKKIEWSAAEGPIVQTLRGLRGLPDDVRAKTTMATALEIRKLPAGEHKVMLASHLANLSTEGDFGKATQEVTTTLAQAVRETPLADQKGEPAGEYFELASLVRYEHMELREELPQVTRATQKLEEIDKRRQEANFTLTDLQGKAWALQELKGKVVLVNFWATWCPPCRKEMPDLEKLYREYAAKGFVVLAISDEDVGKVRPFVEKGKFSYPVLLDPGRKVNDAFVVDGIPKSFLYDRDGRLVAQSIDMRTEHQFREMLALAGLR